jgi:hypothetical protein
MTIPEIENGAYRPTYSSLPIEPSVTQGRKQSARKLRETLGFLRATDSTDIYSIERNH